MSSDSGWAPTTFLRFEENFDTSMGTARIITDGGAAYIKALGNRQGPHPLACEWVGTRLANWFGLPTLEAALLAIDATTDEIPFRSGGKAHSGTAFVTRAINGHAWGGTSQELDDLVNREAVSRLVVFDTWTRNCDRHPPNSHARKPNYDNVFFQDVIEDGVGKSRLIAMDQTHCFTCGRDLNDQIACIDFVKDERLYGLFPGFRGHVQHHEIKTGVDRLRDFREETAGEIIATIPSDWEVSVGARSAMKALICERAIYVADTILDLVQQACWPSHLFDGCSGVCP
jgi:hypothetical protein